MRPTIILVALPFARAIPQGPHHKHATTAPDPKWSGSRRDARDDGPPHNLGDGRPRRDSTVSGGASFTVCILADTNRDGKVDVEGETDTVGKEMWTDDIGALFLANIVDTDRRCSSQITGSCATELGEIFHATSPLEPPELDPEVPDPPTNGSQESWDKWSQGLTPSQEAIFAAFSLHYRDYWELPEADRNISACHDAVDDILRNSTYLAPLRTLPIPGLGDSATASITVTSSLAASKVRLFHKKEADGQWVYITSNYTFEAQELKAGLELGIDARDVRRPGGWDGRATVQFKVEDKGREARDSVALRVAPVLTQHPGQAARQLLTSETVGLDRDVLPVRRFTEKLGNISACLGLETPMHVFKGCFDQGTREFFEPTYMSIPGPNGPVSLYIMIRSGQDWREFGRKVFQDLRNNNVGAIQHLSGLHDSLSAATVDTIPPYSYDGKSFPAGRAVTPAQMKTRYMMAFWDAQETQAPIQLNTSWLSNEQVDEIFQFLPANNTLGWVLMAADPLAGLEMLQKVQHEGHGRETAVSRPRSPTDAEKWHVNTTIDELLNSHRFAELQSTSAGLIENSIEILKRETGLTDADIIRQPCMYKLGPDAWGGCVTDVWKYSAKESNETRRETGTPPSELGQQPADKEGARSPGSCPDDYPDLESWGFDALYPCPISSVVVDNKHIIAPNPWGPLVEGRDVLAEATDAAYAKAGYTVRYMDNWFTHHLIARGFRTESNVIRYIPGEKWW